MRAGLYARVSTKDQVDDGFSIPAQLRALRAYAESQGWEVTAEYVDEGLSAAKESASARPQFRRLLDDVDARRIDVVIVHKLDRFSRNLVVTMQSLARLQSAGAGFASLSEHIDMTTPSGRLMLGVFALFAQFYSDNLATEVSKGRAERAAQGLWNGDLPFGYISTGDPKVPPAIVPAEAALVERAFRMYAGGTLSAHDIAGWLNDQGARPRSKRGLTRFTKATVMDMLTNSFYAGMVHYRGEELAGRHMPIVAPALFDEVRRVRVSRRKITPALKAHPGRTYYLQGIGRCASCGRNLICGFANGSRRYRDTSRDKHVECHVQRASMGADAVEGQLAALFRRMVLPDNWRERLAAKLASQADDGSGARRRAIKARLDRLAELYADGDLTRLRYESERATLRSELESLTAQAMASPENDATEQLERYGAAWDAMEEHERAEIVRAVFEEVYVDLDAGRVAVLKPRPVFLPLMRVLWDENVIHGDPERPRVNHDALYRPVIAMVEAGSAAPYEWFTLLDLGAA